MISPSNSRPDCMDGAATLATLASVLALAAVTACVEPFPPPPAADGTTEAPSTTGAVSTTTASATSSSTGVIVETTGAETAEPVPMPVPADDECYVLAQGDRTFSPAEGVLANDDAGGSDLPLVVLSYDSISARGGVVSMEETGELTYSPPDETFWGEDELTYTVGYAGLPDGPTAQATVRLVVRPREIQLTELPTQQELGGLPRATRIDGPIGSNFGHALAGEARIDEGDEHDIVIGAPGGGGLGRAFVIFGDSQRTPVVVQPSVVEADRGFVLEGQEGFSPIGIDVAVLNDGDGVTRSIVIARGGRSVAVLRGMVWPSPTILDPSCAAGACDYFHYTATSLYGLETSLANLGDVNGDSLDDLAVGYFQHQITEAPQRGRVFIVHGMGAEGDFGTNIGLTVGLPPSIGYYVDGIAPTVGSDTGSSLGFTMAGVGNLVGGSGNDLLVGGPTDNEGAAINAGRAYLVETSSSGVVDAAPGYHVSGALANDRLGLVVAGRRHGADADGDGVADYLVAVAPVSASGLDVHLVFGGGERTSFVIGSPDTPADVLSIPQVGNGVGDVLTLWRDLDGDGRDEIVIASVTGVRVIYGRDVTGHETIDASTLEVADGFVMLEDGAGSPTVAPAGDFDGDGREDLLVATPNDAEGDHHVYVVYGFPAGPAGGARCLR